MPACGIWVPPPPRTFRSNLFWSKGSSRSETMSDIRGNCHHFSLLCGSLKCLWPPFLLSHVGWFVVNSPWREVFGQIVCKSLPLDGEAPAWPIQRNEGLGHRAGGEKAEIRPGQGKRSKTIRCLEEEFWIWGRKILIDVVDFHPFQVKHFFLKKRHYLFLRFHLV